MSELYGVCPKTGPKLRLRKNDISDIATDNEIDNFLATLVKEYRRCQTWFLQNNADIEKFLGIMEDLQTVLKKFVSPCNMKGVEEHGESGGRR